MDRKPDGEIEYDADYGSCDRRQCGIQGVVGAQDFDERSAEEDPKKARRESDPGREQTAKRSGQQRRKGSGITIRRHEGHELQDHDQRPRCRLGHAETVEHLAGTEPSVRFNRLLRDIGKARIRAAESHDCHLAEKDRDLAEDIRVAKNGNDRSDRD